MSKTGFEICVEKLVCRSAQLGRVVLKGFNKLLAVLGETALPAPGTALAALNQAAGELTFHGADNVPARGVAYLHTLAGRAHGLCLVHKA